MTADKPTRERDTLHVSVPATSANLGAGFDVLGLALDLRNTFHARLAPNTTIHIVGNAPGVPLDETNLFYRAFRHMYELKGQQAPPLDITMELGIPPGRGLGSSATAVVGGLVAANAFMGVKFGLLEILAEAVRLEYGGHPDNVAPALLGGLVVNVLDRGRVISLRVPFPKELKVVLFIPDFEMDTVHGRALMPKDYPTNDVVFNTSRVALFLSAIALGRYELLRVAMEDRVHQPYRAQIFPLLPMLIEVALEAGACGACLSGGGSAVLALTTERMDKIAGAMSEAAHEAGVAGEAKVLDVDQRGAHIRWERPAQTT